MLIAFLGTLAALIVSLCLNKIYKAEASIMPIGGPKAGGLSMMASQAGLVGLLGGGSNGPSNQILAILNSRTLAEIVIEKYNLMPILFRKAWDANKNQWKNQDPQKQPSLEDAVKVLHQLISINDDKKSQMIVLDVEFTDPKIAAELANNYIVELGLYISSNTFTSAKQNRIFIEQQLERNKEELLESGKDLNNFYNLNKISNIIPTVDVNISSDNGAKHTAIAGDSRTSGPSDTLQEQADRLKEQLSNAKIVKDIPQQVYLQYLTLRREVLGQINSLLTHQYEMAKIEEAKEDINFQVIDSARIPIKKFGPKRSQIVLTSMLASLFFAVLYAFFREYLVKTKPSE